MTSPAPSSRIVRLDLGGASVEVEFRRHSTARFYRLAFRRDGTFRCTVPRRGTFAEANDFVARHREWILNRLKTHHANPGPPREWTLGAAVWYRGEQSVLRASTDSPGIELGSLRIPAPPGTPADLRPWIESHLRRLALAELPPRTREFARIHGLEIAAVRVRNQRSRWGSCSARRVISLNWRLVQLPPEVSDYIILHELAHLRHLNHSARFWAEVARLCPGWEAAERWIKAHGSRLL